MNKQKNDMKRKPLLTRMAKKMGERSVDAACVWWINQPKVPDSMKKKD